MRTFLWLVSIAVVFLTLELQASNYDHVFQTSCSEKEIVANSTIELPELNHPENDQKQLGVCYGFSAAYLLSSLLDKNISIPDLLMQCDTTALDKDHTYAVLHRIRNKELALVHTKKDHFLSYDAFEYGCSDTRNNFSFAKANRRLRESFEFINDLIKKESIPRVKIPPYNIYVFDSEKGEDLIAAVADHFQVGVNQEKQIPLSLSLCVNQSTQSCEGHVVTIVGSRKVLCKGEHFPRTEWKIKNSWGGLYSGWYDAHTLAQSSTRNDANLTWILPCGELNQPKCENTILGKYPLHYLSTAGDLEEVRKILKIKESVNQINSTSRTPLFLASAKGYLEIINLLIKAGAQVDLPDRLGTTPLIVAASNGHTAVVNALIEAKADRHHIDNLGVTALYLAAQNGHIDTVNALIKAKVDVNKRSEKLDNPPLLIAIEMGHLEVAKSLIEAGADIRANTNRGATPMILAVINGRTEIVKLLYEKGVIIDSTVRQYAIAGGHKDTLKFLESVK